MKLILEQMVSTTKSTRFVSCDCSRQIHHARFLLSRTIKIDLDRRVHRRLRKSSNPFLRKEERKKEIISSFTFIISKNYSKFFIRDRRRIGERDRKGRPVRVREERREKSRKGIVLQLRSLN